MKVPSEPRPRPQETQDLHGLAESLLGEVMGEVNATSSSLWVLGLDQAFRPVLSRGGSHRASRMDPGDVLRRHEEIFTGTPFFEQEAGKIVFHSFFLPLVRLDTLVGLVHLETAPAEGKAAAALLPRLRKIAERYAPLVHDALTLERIRANPLRDLESDAYNEPFLLDFLHREISRARRYRRRLGLVALEVEGVEAVSRSLGPRLAQGLLRDLTEAVRGILRDHDVVAHPGEFRLLVALPDTDRLGCRVVGEKILRGMRQLDYLRGRMERYGLVPHVGFACFPEDGKDSDALMLSALERVHAARRDPFRATAFREKPFWATVEELMGPGDLLGKAPETARGDFATSFFYLLQEAITNDVGMHPSRRGLLYIASGNLLVTEALLQKNTHLRQAATRISLLGDLTGTTSLRELNVNMVAVPPEKASTFQFILHLSELHAYGICAALRKGDQWSGFHTAHDPLVEGLVFKLRDEFGLQEQI